MLLFYGLLVLIVIIISLLVRVAAVIKDSKFDGQHRFTLVLGDKKTASGLMSFEPITSSLSLLTFSNKSKIPIITTGKALGIMPDGFIKTNFNFELGDAIPPDLQTLLFNFNKLSTNVTFYDLLQFYIYSSKIPESTVSFVELNLSSDSKYIDKTSMLLFNDSVITSENLSIQVINATSKAGLGKRLERAITNLGGNVVSVESATNKELKSKILYYGSESYTLNKIGILLNYRKEKLSKQAIAEIVIVIGEDNKNTEVF